MRAGEPAFGQIPKNQVLLLEAGGKDKSPLIHIPAGFIKTLNNPDYNWGFQTEPEANTNNRAIPIARGKALGGSSSINGMVYVRVARRGTMTTGRKWAIAAGPGMMCCRSSSSPKTARVRPTRRRGVGVAGS